MSGVEEFFEVCGVDDVSQDTPFKAELNGVALAVFQLDDKYYVTEDLCSHGPGSLSEGYVEGDEVECPFHQGKFSIVTGEATLAPCTKALRIWPVTVKDGKVFIIPGQYKN